VVSLGLISSVFYPMISFWLLGTLYSSIWWPQIVKSARRNLRKPLLKRYVIGTSICRQFFILCECDTKLENLVTNLSPTRFVWLSRKCSGRRCKWLVFCPRLLRIVTDEPVAWVWTFPAMMALQVVVILLQEYIGPAFFLPPGVS
jgi:hypothetical protein